MKSDGCVKNDGCKKSIPDISLHLIESISDYKDDNKHGDKNERSGNKNEKGYENIRKNNRTRVPWTEDEMEALKTGVASHGAGNWTVILDEFSKVFNKKRRVIDLVNKHREMSKSSSFYTTSSRDWVEIGEDGKPLEDVLGEVRVFSDKFPYNAAKKIAKGRPDPGDDGYVITIREIDRDTELHYYMVTMENGQRRVAKVLKNPSVHNSGA